MGKFLIGTCGWSYDDWVGPFYPSGTPRGEFLTHDAGYGPLIARAFLEELAKLMGEAKGPVRSPNQG